MTGTLISAAVLVVGLFLWDRWEQRRGVDQQHAARQGEFGLRLVKLVALAVLALAAGLALQGLGVPGAIVVVIVALLALLLLIYVMPFFAPRKR